MASFLTAALLFGLTTATPLPANTVTQNTCSYTVKAANGSSVPFSNHVSYDFTSLKTMPSWFTVQDNVLVPSISPYCPRIFNANNVQLSGAGLKLGVPGGQTCDGSTAIKGAEVMSSVTDIFYASVRTVAAVSSVSGTINAAFFYANDTDEIDIETQTATYTNLQLTNQAHENSAASTYTIKNPGFLPSLIYHEYRYDWYTSASGNATVTFFVDGKLVKTITQNVPRLGGALYWNNWSNGGSWTLGPPKKDNVYYVASVEAFFNRTSGVSNCTSAAVAAAKKVVEKIGVKVGA